MELLDLTSDELAFRDEVREFLAENLTPELREAGAKTLWSISEFKYGRQWQRILHARGWGAPNWPVEYGGTGWTPVQKMIWATEIAHARPPSVMNMGRDLCAPCIMAFGTPDQKAEMLPRILSGDDWWAQGYSEPGAGSDLAALRLCAVRDGDDYVLTGSKTWTTMAHHANRIFCLVRTGTQGPKQAGITFLLIDMAAPGITVRPIINLAGVHDFNEVIFDDVRTPQTSRLGEEGQGWAVARHLLGLEHGGSIYDGVEMQRRLSWLEDIAALESDGDGGTLLDSREFGERIADVAIECAASDAMTRRLVEQVRQGHIQLGMSELLNIRRRELGQSLTQLLMDAVGHYALPLHHQALAVGGGPPDVGPDHALLPTAFFLAQRAATIAGGTADIHRNNVARHVLKL